MECSNNFVAVLMILWGDDTPEDGQFEDTYRVISYRPSTGEWYDYSDPWQLINTEFIPAHDLDYGMRTLNLEDFYNPDDDIELYDAAILLCEHLADPDKGPAKQQLDAFFTCYNSKYARDGFYGLDF